MQHAANAELQVLNGKLAENIGGKYLGELV